MPTPEIIENVIYSTEDLSELFELPYQSMRLLIKRGHIKGAKIGKNWFVSGKSLLKLFDENDDSSKQMDKASETEEAELINGNYEE